MDAREMAQQILARARSLRAERERVGELRQLAERTARDYEADQRADRDLPPRHRELRRMLLGLPAPPREGA